jgi:hypothetical protein
MAASDKKGIAATLADSQDAFPVLPPLSPLQTKYQMIFDQNCTRTPKYSQRYRDTIVLLLSWVENDLNVEPEVLLESFKPETC